jgi:hypothetical protein
MVRIAAFVLVASVIAPPARAQTGRIALDAVASADADAGSTVRREPGVWFDVFGAFRIRDGLDLVARPVLLRRTFDGRWQKQMYQLGVRYERPIDSTAGSRAIGPHRRRADDVADRAWDARKPAGSQSCRLATLRVLPAAASGRSGDTTDDVSDRRHVSVRRTGHAGDPTMGRTRGTHRRLARSWPEFLWLQQAAADGELGRRSRHHAAHRSPPGHSLRLRTVREGIRVGQHTPRRSHSRDGADRGHTRIAGEVVASTLETARATDATARGGWIEATQTLHPRVFLAGRGDVQRFAYSLANGQPASQTYQRHEAIVGFRVTPDLTLRAGYMTRKGYVVFHWDDQFLASVTWQRKIF